MAVRIEDGSNNVPPIRGGDGRVACHGETHSAIIDKAVGTSAYQGAFSIKAVAGNVDVSGAWSNAVHIESAAIGGINLGRARAQVVGIGVLQYTVRNDDRAVERRIIGDTQKHRIGPGLDDSTQTLAAIADCGEVCVSGNALH